MRTVKTTLEVTVNQYSAAYVDDLQVEFTPTYEHGSLIGTMFRLTPVNSTAPCFVKKLNASEEFELRTKVRVHGRVLNVGLRGSLLEGKTTKVTLIVKNAMRVGESEYTWR